MNRSPGCAWRESVQTRVTVIVGEPRSSSPPQLSAMYVKERASTSGLGSEAERFQRLARINAIVKRNNGVLKLLVGLVAFARDHHRVVGGGQTQDFVNGPFAVQFDAITVAANAPKACFDRRRDFLRRFAARIVARDNVEIGKFG